MFRSAPQAEPCEVHAARGLRAGNSRKGARRKHPASKLGRIWAEVEMFVGGGGDQSELGRRLPISNPLEPVIEATDGSLAGDAS